MKKFIFILIPTLVIAIIFYNQYKENSNNDLTCTVSFNSLGGTEIEQQELNKGETIRNVIPAKDGYTFYGWFTDFKGGAQVDIFDINSAVYKDLTLYANWKLNSYTITFNTFGAPDIAPITALYSSKIEEPVSPSKEGYLFAGWYRDSSLTKLYTFSTMPPYSFTLYAKYIETNTITFETNGGGIVETISQEYNSIITKPNDPIKEGYIFDGWYIDSEFTQEFNFNRMPNYSITLYAKWIEQQYTITFDTDGGSDVDPIFKKANEIITKPNDPIKEGYIFAGWYTDLEFTSHYSFSVMPSESFTLYAKWILPQITFDTNGGSLIAPIIQESNTIITKPIDPIKEGYTFGGWYEDEFFNTEFHFSTMPEYDITLYALWTENLPSISFETSGGSYVDPITQEAYTPILAPEEPSKEGYQFDGWYIDELCTTDYEFNLMPEESIMLYAKWLIVNYKVQINSYYEVISYRSKDEMIVNFLYDFYEYVHPEEDLNTFIHGANETSGYGGTWFNYKLKLFTKNENNVDASLPYFINQPEYNKKWLPLFNYVDELVKKYHSPYSLWDSIFTGMIRFNQYITSNSLDFSTDELAFTPSFSIVSYSYNIENPFVLETPSYLDYSFLGWYVDSNYTSQFDITSMQYDNINLYGKWDVFLHSILFDTNGGRLVDSISQDANTPITEPTTPTKEGYTFIGWYLDMNDDTQYVFDTMPTSDLILYAKWTINQYEIDFIVYGGSTVQKIVQEYNTLISEPNPPTKEGYTFKGWYTDEGLTNVYLFNRMPSKNITLYAKWEINIYTISFNTNGGSVVNPIRQVYNSQITAPTAPTKSGYEFVGWYKESNFVNSYTFSSMPSYDLTLYAKFKDITKPTIQLNGNSSVSITQYSSYSELGATATDNHDESVSVTITGSVNINSPGTYTITYTAKDSSNNVSSLTRTVTVVAYVYKVGDVVYFSGTYYSTSYGGSEGYRAGDYVIAKINSGAPYPYAIQPVSSTVIKGWTKASYLTLK